MDDLTEFCVGDLTRPLFSKVQLDKVARKVEGNMPVHIRVAENRVELVCESKGMIVGGMGGGGRRACIKEGWCIFVWLRIEWNLSEKGIGGGGGLKRDGAYSYD